MLSKLRIKNVALIENLEINFDNNLNVITGETGSGKTIMLNSLNFVFGDRLDKTLLREGCDYMKVDALFVNVKQSVLDILTNEFGVECCDDSVLISRDFNLQGKSTARINGEMVSVNILKKISSLLIDMHSQHEHQMLMNADYQLNILDKYCGENAFSLLDEIHGLIEKINECNKEIKLIGGSSEEKQNLIDLYSYHINEIDNANLKEGELEELETKLIEMKNFEKISIGLENVIANTYRNNFFTPAIDLLNSSVKELSNLTNFGEKYFILKDRLNSSIIEIEDIISTVNDLHNECEFNENEFNAISERIEFLKQLYKKYGGTYNSTIEYKTKKSEELDFLYNSEEKRQEKEQEKAKYLSKIIEVETKLSNLRKQGAEKLSVEITNELKHLGMKNAKFFVEFNTINEQYSSKGVDEISFMFSGNLGFTPKPISKIASGGELSRFMLAYKIVANQLDEIDTLIFDEIDTGLSGQMAEVVAECLGKLARLKQVITITHLPQICAMADKNFKVQKFMDTTTHTDLQEIYDDRLYEEITRLMGVKLDENSLNLAKRLKDEYTKYKKSI